MSRSLLTVQSSWPLAALLATATCGGPAKKSAEPPTPPPITPVPAEPPAKADPLPPPPPPPPPAKIVTVTVVSAEIEGTMPNHEDWDSDNSPPVEGVPKPILAYLGQHPELEATASMVGVPISAEKLEEYARKSAAADPMVFFEVGDLIFRTTVRPRAFNPLWDFPFTFFLGELDGKKGVDPAAVARIYVVDYDGPTGYDTIGSTLIPLSQLRGEELHQIGPFGSVKTMTLQVKEQDAVAGDPRSTRLAVPGNAEWTDTGIDLVAGQQVTIDAADEVCSKGGSLSHCSGPEGQRTTSSYNQHGFEKVGHAALIGALGDTRFAVARSLSMVAPSSGRLYLGVNDRDVGDNRGSYAVRVMVDPIPR